MFTVFISIITILLVHFNLMLVSGHSIDYQWKKKCSLWNTYSFLSEGEVFVRTGRSVVSKMAAKLKNSLEFISEKVSSHSNGSGYYKVDKVTAFH